MIGTLDVDAMLASISPRQFSEWIAYYRIEPWGDEWEQAATVAAAAHNAGMIASNRFDLPPEVLGLRTTEHFDPRQKNVKPPRRAETAEEFFEAMSKQFG